MRRVPALTALVTSLVLGCSGFPVGFVADPPASVEVDGRTYVASVAREYAIAPAVLVPHARASVVNVGYADGDVVYRLAGVDPRELLVLPAIPGAESAYFLLIRDDIVRSPRARVDDLGIRGLCRYRAEPASACP